MTGSKTGLREALRSWAEPPFFSRYDATPRRTLAGAKAVTRRLGELEARQPESYDLQKLYGRALNAADGDGIRQLNTGDLRRLPWVLFHPKARSEADRRLWLGGRPAVARDYREWLRQRRRTAPSLALIHEFLRVYPVDLPTFREWLRILRVSVRGARSTALQRLDLDLFEWDGDLKVVARMVADRQADVGSFGLSPGLARCAFIRSGARKHLRETGRRIKAGTVRHDEIKGLLNVLELDGGLRFMDGEMCRSTAKALLRPFAKGQRNDPRSLDTLCAWFVRCFGDPRMPAYGHRWRDVPTKARMVVVRWLVQGTFEQFFQLLRRTAYDHHWRYRQAFWTAYLERNMVEEAWFVLGTHARILLRGISKRDLPESNGALSGAAADQSVLLMRIGGATVAEWSHSGSCRIWRQGRQWAPDLYDEQYHRSELACSTADFVQPHHASEKGRWQYMVAEQIEEYTGRSVGHRQYMPASSVASVPWRYQRGGF